MRRYSVTEAPRGTLLASIAEHIARDEHLNPDKTARIEAYRRAMLELENNADEARVPYFLFRVVDSAPHTYHVLEGSKDEVEAELQKYGKSRADAGGEPKARRFARALLELEAGTLEVQVEDVVYRVVEG